MELRDKVEYRIKVQKAWPTGRMDALSLSKLLEEERK